MRLKHYQQKVDDTLQPYAKSYWDPLSNLAKPIEEVSEMSRILNHQYGDKPKKPEEGEKVLGDELAYVVYTVICIANSQSIALDDHMEKAIAKSEARDKERFAKKSDG